MPGNDTVTYQLEGKQYVVPKGTSLDEVDQYIKGQSPDKTQETLSQLSPNATKPELPSPEFTPTSSQGYMDVPGNQLKLDQSIAADTTMGAGGAALGNAKFANNAPAAVKWGVHTAKTLGAMKALGYVGDKLGIPYAGIAALSPYGKPGPMEEEPPPDNINYERNQQLNRKAITSAPSGREVSGPATGVAPNPRPPTISEPPPAPPADTIDYARNQRLNRQTIGAAPTGREYVGPATGSAPNPRPIPGVPQPTPEPEPPADTIDYARNQRLNRANLTRSIGSTQPSGPATGGAPPSVGRSPQAGAAVPYGRSVTAGDLATWSKEDLWGQYMKEREAGGSRDLMKRISDELARRGETKAVGSQIK